MTTQHVFRAGLCQAIDSGGALRAVVTRRNFEDPEYTRIWYRLPGFRRWEGDSAIDFDASDQLWVHDDEEEEDD